MPQPLHPEWDGFDKLVELDDKGKVIPGVPAKARCRKCSRTFSKTGQGFMRDHKKNCGKTKLKKQQRNRTSSLTSQLSENGNSSGSSFDDLSAADDAQFDLSAEASDLNGELSTRSSTPSTSSFEEHSDVRESQSRHERQRSTSTSSLEQGDMLRDDTTSAENLSRTSSLPHLAVRANAKRKRQLVNNEESASADEKDLALYRYVLCEDLDFKAVEAKSFTSLLRTFDPTFEIPSAEQLRSAVGMKAADEICSKNLNKQHNGVLQIICQVVEGRVETIQRDQQAGAIQEEDDEDANVIHHPDTVLVLSLLGNTTKDWTYVKHCKFESEYNADFTSKIEAFCDQSVLECRKEYGINVNFVLHSGTCNLRIAKDIICDDGTEFTYYRISEITVVLSKLQCRLVSDASNHRDVTNFYDNIQNSIPDAITSENLTMSEAVHRIFQVIGRLDEHNQRIVCAELLKIISPLHLACKVFHPAFHGEILNEEVFRPLYKLFCDFQIQDGPELIANLVPYYLSKSAACFRILYKKKREGNPIRFWEITKLDKNLNDIELLAEYALNLIQIPAKMKQIDLIDIFEKRSHHQIVRSDFDKVFFTYMLDSLLKISE